MGIEELLKSKRDDILRIATQHGALNVRVFGSVARGEATADSDVDFLVELEPERTLLDYIALIQAGQELLGCSVDVAEPDNLHEAIREQVLQEAVLLQLLA
ncbi:MAG TPA: DNA polymerase subunit beta [Microcoleaceae bacterium UBA9251]|jgi:Predicted nucleotidyltransferases|nr:DNA polymerase subunit beta [Microcoleaceae cyanobacterium UBA9251]